MFNPCMIQRKTLTAVMGDKRKVFSFDVQWAGKYFGISEPAEIVKKLYTVTEPERRDLLSAARKDQASGLSERDDSRCV